MTFVNFFLRVVKHCSLWYRPSKCVNRDKEVAKKVRVKPRGRQTNTDEKSILLDLVNPDPNRRDLLIEYLHIIQDKYGHIKKSQITALAELMKLSMSEVYEIASFYHHFEIIESDEHKNKQLDFQVRICDSLTCQMYGSSRLKEELDLLSGSDYKAHSVSCVGRCDKAPVAVVGKNTIGYATPEIVHRAVKDKDIKPTKINPTSLNHSVG